MNKTHNANLKKKPGLFASQQFFSWSMGECEVTLENGGALMYTHERNKQGKNSHVATLSRHTDYSKAAVGVA